MVKGGEIGAIYCDLDLLWLKRKIRDCPFSLAANHSTYYCGNIVRLGADLPGETDPVRKGIGNFIYEKFSSSLINLGVAQLMNIILKDRKCLDYKSHEYFEEKTRKLLLLTKN